MGCLELENLSISISRYEGFFQKRDIQVVEEISLRIEPGEIVALVGASGAGKSLLALAILGLLPNNARLRGLIRYNGDVLDVNKMQKLRGREITYIPQAVSALDPLMPVGRQILSGGNDRVERKVEHVLNQVHMPDQVKKLYPFQLSGGMARKVLLTMALAEPSPLIIADEPTPGLSADDLQVVGQLFRKAAFRGSAVLLITHDLFTASKMADRIAVMDGGTLVEVAPVRDFAGQGERLRHPYSRTLWQALPQNGFAPVSGNLLVQTTPTEATAEEKGCPYFTLCSFGTGKCRRVRPMWQSARGGMVRCVHAT